jgi:hypothetical protein
MCVSVCILHQSHGFVQTQGNVQVLNSRTTCSLAQVIKSRTQDSLLGNIIRKDKELQLVGILELVRSQKGIPLQQTRLLGTLFAQGHDFDKDGSLVVLFQGFVHLGTSRSLSQPRIVQGDRDDHALVKVGNSRLEDGLGSQTRVLSRKNVCICVLAGCCVQGCLRLDIFRNPHVYTIVYSKHSKHTLDISGTCLCARFNPYVPHGSCSSVS